MKCVNYSQKLNVCQNDILLKFGFGSLMFRHPRVLVLFYELFLIVFMFHFPLLFKLNRI